MRKSKVVLDVDIIAIQMGCLAGVSHGKVLLIASSETQPSIDDVTVG